MLNSKYIVLLKGSTPSRRKAGGSYVNQIHDNTKLVFGLAIKEGILRCYRFFNRPMPLFP